MVKVYAWCLTRAIVCFSIDYVPACSMSGDAKPANHMNRYEAGSISVLYPYEFYHLTIVSLAEKNKNYKVYTIKLKIRFSRILQATLKSPYTRWKILRCKIIGSNSYRIVFLNEFQVSVKKFASYIAFFFFISNIRLYSFFHVRPVFLADIGVRWIFCITADGIKAW